MNLFGKLLLARPAARLVRLRADPAGAQRRFVERFAAAHARTAFGREHGLAAVRTPADLARAVPLRGYDEFRPWIERTLAGEPDVLVPGRPLYYGVTTGTTGGEKRIPVTRPLLDAAAGGFILLLSGALLDRDTLAPVLGKLLVLGATTPLRPERDGVPTGAMSTIAIRERPWFLRRKIMPGNELDHLPSWDEKLDALIARAASADVRVVAGMPPWLLALFDRLEAARGVCHARLVWPNLSLVLHAGTFLGPYRVRLEEAVGLRAREGKGTGHGVWFRNMYSATEGVFAVQDSDDDGLLPLADDVHFDLVPVETLASASPARVGLADAEPDVEYALAVASWTGMPGYLMGDTVRVVSRAPLRLVVSGRTKQRANVAGEKVTVEEVEAAALEGARALGLRLREVTLVALGPDASADRKPRHRWLVEAEPDLTIRRPPDGPPPELAAALDHALAARSATYRVRREGATPALGAPEAVLLPPGTYAAWQARKGREGAHHKVPRITTEAPHGLELH